MARSLNKAMLIGNLGADPEVRTTSNGNRVAQFSLATGRSWTDAEGTSHERTEWHRVVAWGRLVDVVEAYAKKGERVYVEGEIQYRSYEDAEGVTRYVTEINARELVLLGGRGEEAAEAPRESAPTAPRARRATRAPSTEKARRSGGKRAATTAEDDLPF
ncbi:MAG TPA: single-stranded DNA-binding protein [Longimicrobiaceae bacterium]|nr:single-stranded DNA-binding protein [Longimicrobiaceae bacterium]